MVPSMGIMLDWLVTIACLLGGIVAVAYFWKEWQAKPKWTEKEKQQHQGQLAGFITEAQQLRKRLNEDPLPTGEHNAWVDRVDKYLHDNLGEVFVVRFGDLSGMTLHGNASERSKISRSIEGRSR